MKKMIFLTLFFILSAIMVEAYANSAINAYALRGLNLKNFLTDDGSNQVKNGALENIPLTVATVCMNAKTDSASNLETFTAYINEASQKGAILVVFPEIALQQNPGWGTSSYTPTEAEFQYVQDSAETIPGPSTEALVRIAKEHNIFVIFGMTEKSPNGDLYNTSVFLGPTGIIGKHRKGFLWDQATGGNEHLFYEYGSDNGLVESPLGKVGLIICVEMGYLLGLEQGSAGADFLVTVAAWPSFGSSPYESYTKRNAAESDCWHIVANQVGTVGHATDYGHSRIINPEGVVVADTGAQEGMVIATIGEITLNVNVDLNGDGIVDANDMCIIIDHWGEDYPPCDIGPMPWGNGVVDVKDLIVVAEHLFEVYPSADTVDVNEADNGEQVELELGKLLVVTLESNPSTGYRWELLENNESILKQFGQVEFKPSETSEPPLVGAGGWEIFRFKAVSAGQTTLELVYHRSWEDAEPLTTFSIQVTVP